MKKLNKVVIPFLLGVATLIPAAASKDNLVGYQSLCTFVPISTAMLWGMAALQLRAMLSGRSSTEAMLESAGAERR